MLCDVILVCCCFLIAAAAVFLSFSLQLLILFKFVYKLDVCT